VGFQILLIRRDGLISLRNPWWRLPTLAGQQSDAIEHLAVAHVSAIDNDDIRIPHSLNRQREIASPEDLIINAELSAETFGGNALGRNPISQPIMGRIWHSGCE
jgi:hypothetical protein